MTYYIIVFKNTYDAMSAEKKLNELKYNFKIMPTPTSITMSCGICVRIDSEDEIKSILNQEILEYKNIYLRENGEYILINE
ncbi:DUF3343 domain-containing protein [Clostridium saccharobutylicum]|uniref:Putative Se/S carrier protein-like domain-containing protein n=1 Tax=Clostridium saccharobutylicum DSM 13864 TaxID=1345695 RepID=U5N0M4_CLOSA|nr:DUF3343 domain-containing protein [Clostridium saccharobutylicum]AGX45461.1 hypothetical protein CLSA_c45370 [Clostridium saccharobutylicum DSM 13864]AQR92734.1 hypothetical protein CLOSC_45120 [Clostridium saccharobutylicum]AQS02636.1 hypothetical protein CSACC_45130 [Clostridium saccharobutylicum]AQS12242.1 hypothetical protein CLOBY_44380 [Clostridium saccharobutylicum]AQS16619.1 hypothetical protein CLOSACC_45090 [Clostridium saccharobutylicum]